MPVVDVVFILLWVSRRVPEITIPGKTQRVIRRERHHMGGPTPGIIHSGVGRGISEGPGMQTPCPRVQEKHRAFKCG